MKLPPLTIFGRTFLLMLAALVVANALGIVLLVTRPPMHNAPVRLSEIARQLSGVEGRGPMPDAFGRGFPPNGAPPNGPPPNGPPPGGPPPGFEGRPGGPMNPLRTRREWQMRDSAEAPAEPKGTDHTESERLRGQLAIRLGVGADRVRVYVRDVAAPGGGAMGFGDPQLREGFTAAWRRDDGTWRVMDSVIEGFPNAFQRQALWLFAIGLAVLLPMSWLFARALAAPVRRFSDAARRLGLDPHAAPLEHSGPREMQAAIDSFNAMQGRITRLLQERAHMVGAIAHDLRTPLMRLAFRLEGLQSPLKEKVEADLEEMRSMISAALDFLRDQSARGARQRLDFRLLVESVVDDQVDVGQDVKLATDGGIPESIVLEGDPLSLRRMVVNLVDNARKYGERARLALEVTRGQCVLRVDDDGPGIPESLQQRVFEPFFRTEQSRNRDTGGIGLGLTTVRAVVLDHGGTIELRNRHEGGLRVIVSLPMTGQ